ncbi:deoxyribodipyrimidine photo-lyase [Buchnera aphidicola]|uniref:Deoxyribodipyrimidine photo-lyase n=1 Tax=Buchnera aphidicola (Aphis gossypii) TaxID=98785 RepID=A0A5J6ZD16_9GAMM|nr:deoxyribodipyrimidine photo-lyase [Buchnera aphidicola]QFQ32129.1 deoxyribodipyrimidine photo-lyase [Buchnera aphidicola (Aphis gossypii)]UPT14655.1 deoxyribodipyrimidine photo-lyase [Buchnera aphidicola (Aphis gossypii)]
MNKNLIWFRNDLRIHDNTALYHACLSETNKVIGLFIFTSKQWSQHYVSTKKISFLYQNLKSLKDELLKLNINLYHHECTDFLNSIEYLSYFCQVNKINHVFYNYQYEINERNRDSLMKHELAKQGILLEGFHDSILINPNKIKNKNNQPYKKFYFFKKQAIDYLSKNTPICFSLPKKRIYHQYDTMPICLNQNDNINFDKNLFPIGEKEAINRIKDFCNNKIKHYFSTRNFPYLNSTSMLSPYLSLGIISIRYCLKIFLTKYKHKPLSITLNSSWINEIIWREFYYHLLINFPILSKSQSLLKWEKKINWENNINYFHAWKDGRTGFPIIDAAMNQLNKTGWMHNRLRMITSSFLVKNLLIDWREGEKYFMSRLIDGDYALNNGGWQWSASIGSDTTSYIRVFNPLRQSKIFDKSGFFIKKYLPELKMVPNNYIHHPYEWIVKNNCKINYPKPIINHEHSTKKFLLAYKQAQLL